MFIVDKTEINYYGTIILNYVYNGYPFMQLTSSTVPINTTIARDADTNQGDNIHSMVLNLNSSNIASLAYCGINSEGTIVASNSPSATKFVCVVGADTSCKFTSAELTFLAVDGNSSNYTTVDYRSADYTNFVAPTNDTSGISFFYTCSIEGRLINITVSHTVVSNVDIYAITVTSNVPFMLNVFRYDDDANVIVNGTMDCNRPVTVVPISQSLP